MNNIQPLQLFAIVFAITPLLACDGTTEVTSPGQETGYLSGTAVADPATFSNVPPAVEGVSPIPGATCTIEGTNLQGVADANGVFSIGPVQLGAYILICQAEDDGGRVFAWLGVVQLTEGGTKDLGQIELQLTGTITGNVTLADSSDFAGSRVAVLGTSLEGITDAAGNYTIPEVPAGSHDLRLEHSGYAAVTLEGVEVSPGETTSMPSAVLTLANPDGSISIAATTLLDGEAAVGSRTVTVYVTPGSETTRMMLSEDLDFVNATWVPVSNSAEYTFSIDGRLTLYAKFATEGGLESAPIAVDVVVDTSAPGDDSETLVYSQRFCGGNPGMGGEFSTVNEFPPCDEIFAASPEQPNRGIVVADNPNVAIGADVFELTGVTEIALSHDETFDPTGLWQAVSDDGTVPWTLEAGPDGDRMVYAYLRDFFGNATTAPLLGVIGLDQTPPVVEDVQMLDVSTGSFRAILVTDQAVDITFEYGDTPSYGQTVETHSFEQDWDTVVGGSVRSEQGATNAATPGSTQHYRLTLYDRAGNQTVTDDATFTLAP